jgi:hypothetical protein
MNGRLYDPLLGRMLSPDNYTHGSSQGYNRYTYAMNNPLKYTDPDGQNPFLIGAAVGAAFDIGLQLYSNGWDIHNINWTSVAISAAAGAVGGGIGDALSKSAKLTKALGTIANEAVRSFARGAIIGAFSGAGSSLTSGALHGQRGWELARTVGIGTLTGALLGGAFEYGLYKWNQWRGNVKQPVVLTEEPPMNPRGTASTNTGENNTNTWVEQTVTGADDQVEVTVTATQKFGTVDDFNASTAEKLTAPKPLSLKFNGDQAVSHFDKHGKSVMDALGKTSYNLKNYLDDANFVIKNGTYVPELNGYVRLIGGHGSAKFGFVGLNRANSSITTFHIKTVGELTKKIPTLFGY